MFQGNCAVQSQNESITTLMMHGHLFNTGPSPPDLEDQVGHAATAICICSVCVLKQTSGIPVMPFTNILTHSSYSYSHSIFNKSTSSFCSRFFKVPLNHIKAPIRHLKGCQQHQRDTLSLLIPVAVLTPCWLFCGIDEC